jgi:hypothetical protein
VKTSTAKHTPMQFKTVPEAARAIGYGAILRAVNAHEELLEAAKIALDIIGKEPEVYFQRPYTMLKEAIAKAEGR